MMDEDDNSMSFEDKINAYKVREQLLKIEKDGKNNLQENTNELIRRTYLLLKKEEYPESFYPTVRISNVISCFDARKDIQLSCILLKCFKETKYHHLIKEIFNDEVNHYIVYFNLFNNIVENEKRNISLDDIFYFSDTSFHQHFAMHSLYAKYLFPESKILDYVKNDSKLIGIFEKEIFADLKQIRQINYSIEKREMDKLEQEFIYLGKIFE